MFEPITYQVSLIVLLVALANMLVAVILERRRNNKGGFKSTSAEDIARIMKDAAARARVDSARKVRAGPRLQTKEEATARGITAHENRIAALHKELAKMQTSGNTGAVYDNLLSELTTREFVLGRLRG